MAAHICIFEDDQYRRLFPLVYFRPVYDLRCGITSLREKILQAYPKAGITLHCRPYLAEVVHLYNPGTRVNEIPSDSCLFLNGRVIAGRDLSKKIPLTQKSDSLFVRGDSVVAAYVSGTRLANLKEKLGDVLSPSVFGDIPKVEIDVNVVAYPWDIVHLNGQQLAEDFEVLVGKQKKPSRKFAGSHLLGKAGIFIDRSATLKPAVVLDAEKGPIYIGKKVTIMPFTSIVGPAFVGDGSILKAGATIYENTSIGPVCKVGGEVEGSIIHGYSNKQHSGFLGHSYIAPWVNLGAGTNNSDLKNNYSNVKVQMGAQQIDTGLQFVGLTMGDHSKSAINSMFNTGTIVGVCSNIFGFGFPPKFVPSFSWGAAGDQCTTYDVDRAIDVARKVMKRRHVDLSSAEERLFRKVFELTAEDRNRQGMQG
jgi:UDP-N-acetylglucosamine diphosphorylase/glucosamine-1-phosphate N-acetyltransferase